MNIMIKEFFLNIYIVADIDDTEVIWIALLRHADKLVLPEDRTK